MTDETTEFNSSDALNEVRRLIARNQDRGVTEEVTWDLMEVFGALDSHLDEGGALPDQWRNRKRGRPRATEEGEKLDGVTHGSRSGYNKGCRCNQCRRANREHAADFLAKQKETSR
ncbi:MAG TPA: hypothetical protein VIT65_23250 [Microlunatus sp.]